MVYKAKYKCRLCKEEFYSGAVTNKKIAVEEMIYLITDAPNKNPQAPTMNYFHHCINDDIGLADFIGWECANNG